MTSLLNIEFASLTRIDGREGRSKLLKTDSTLFQLLTDIKSALAEGSSPAADRMPLHIEITKDRRDDDFDRKTAQINGTTIDVLSADNWALLGRAFVLRTPAVEGYGETHITIAFYRKHRPALQVMRELALKRANQWLEQVRPSATEL